MKYICSMKKKVIKTANAPAPIGPYSQAILIDDTLYISGQISIEPSTGELITINIIKETNQVMHNLMNILKEAGMDFSHVVKTTIFLKDMNDFPAVNEVYGEFFVGDFPARETVQVAALPKNVNVEISMIAVKD
jgi:2-iminobutanoate/2-iminopropanoate deaminase